MALALGRGAIFTLQVIGSEQFSDAAGALLGRKDVEGAH